MLTSTLPEVLLVAAAFCSACGARETAPAESPASAAPSPKQAEVDPNRALTKDECGSLSQTIVDACNNRGNDRSTEADGWCSDMIQRNAGTGTWVDAECMKHFRYMDAYCFQNANNAHGMMICDRTVDR
jgi:hypothetical protein